MVAVFGWKLKSINIVELTQHWLWNPTCVGIGLSSTQERKQHLSHKPLVLMGKGIA